MQDEKIKNDLEGDTQVKSSVISQKLVFQRFEQDFNQAVTANFE